jgi:hypothetical protein
MSSVVPVVAAIGGSVVGLAGVAATYLSSRGQRATAVSIARIQADHQAVLAREERHQRRLEAAYRDLAKAVEHAEQEVRFAARSVIAGDDLDSANKRAIAAIEGVLEDRRWNYPLPVEGDRHLWSDRVGVLERGFRDAADWVAHGIDGFSNAAYRKREAAKAIPDGKGWPISLSSEGAELEAYLEDMDGAARLLRAQIRSELLDTLAPQQVDPNPEYRTQPIQHMHQFGRTDSADKPTRTA